MRFIAYAVDESSQQQLSMLSNNDERSRNIVTDIDASHGTVTDADDGRADEHDDARHSYSERSMC